MGFGALTLADPALAADLPLKAPVAKAVYDWTGFYVGGHFGYGDASFGPGSNPLRKDCRSRRRATARRSRTTP